MPERTTELGRDLQRRAEACITVLNGEDPESPAGQRLIGKHSAYRHAAELADAAPAETSRAHPVQDLPRGWHRLENDLHGPRFSGPDATYIEIDTGGDVITHDGPHGIPVAVLRAFLAALDAK